MKNILRVVTGKIIQVGKVNMENLTKVDIRLDGKITRRLVVGGLKKLGLLELTIRFILTYGLLTQDPPLLKGQQTTTYLGITSLLIP